MKSLLTLFISLISLNSYAGLSMTCMEKIEQNAKENYLLSCSDEDNHCKSVAEERCDIKSVTDYEGLKGTQGILINQPIRHVVLICGRPSDWSDSVVYKFQTDAFGGPNCKFHVESYKVIGN